MPARRYQPSEEQRRTVRAMAGYGVPQEEIARVVRCSAPTLRRAFRRELDTAVTEANARVMQCRFQQAGTPGNIAAAIFWLKARAGWREKQAVEVSGPGGAAVEPQRIVVELRDDTGSWRNDAVPAAAAGPLLEGTKE